MAGQCGSELGDSETLEARRQQNILDKEKAKQSFVQNWCHIHLNVVFLLVSYRHILYSSSPSIFGDENKIANLQTVLSTTFVRLNKIPHINISPHTLTSRLPS